MRGIYGGQGGCAVIARAVIEQALSDIKYNRRPDDAVDYIESPVFEAHALIGGIDCERVRRLVRQGRVAA